MCDHKISTMFALDVLEWKYNFIWNSFSMKTYLHVDISPGLMNVDGVTKRKVEKGAEVDEDCEIIVASDKVLDEWIGCRAFITSDFDTAENVILELFKSVESRAMRLFGWCGSTLSF